MTMIWNPDYEGMKGHMRRHCNPFWMLSTFRLCLAQAAHIHGAPKIDCLCLPLTLKPTLKRSAGCACEEKVLAVSLESCLQIGHSAVSMKKLDLWDAGMPLVSRLRRKKVWKVGTETHIFLHAQFAEICRELFCKFCWSFVHSVIRRSGGSIQPTRAEGRHGLGFLDVSILFLYSAVQPDCRPKPSIDALAKKKLWDDLHADC